MIPSCGMTIVLLKRGNLGTDAHTGRGPSEDGGRDRGNASTSQGTSNVASTEAGERRGTDAS